MGKSRRYSATAQRGRRSWKRRCRLTKRVDVTNAHIKAVGLHSVTSRALSGIHHINLIAIVHTVGIVGVNGNVGAPTTKALVKSAEEGKINLIIFHRATSNLAGLSKNENVDFRVFELDAPPEKIAEAAKGVNTFISSIGFGALLHEPNLVEGLALSPDLITYIPSMYSTVWTAEDFRDLRLGPVLVFAEAGHHVAVGKKIGVTTVYTGVLALYWFDFGNIDHLAQALTRIATAEPQSVKNKGFSVVTFWPTGSELRDLHAKINGKPGLVKDFTPADFEAQMADAASMGPVKAGYWRKWESGEWGYEAGGWVSDDEYDGPSLKEVALSFA